MHSRHAPFEILMAVDWELRDYLNGVVYAVADGGERVPGPAAV